MKLVEIETVVLYRSEKNHHCLSFESHSTSYDQSLVIVEMLKNILVIFSLVAAAYGSGQLTVLESPNAISFKKQDRLDGKYIGHVFSACTGHSISESVPLKLQFTPFDLAENVCLINIDGIKEFTPKKLKPKSEIIVDGPENSNEVFLNKLQEEGCSIVHVHLNDGLDALGSLQDWCENSLKPENSKFYKMLKDEKNSESKQILEAIIAMSVLSEAKCKMPAFLQIDYNHDASKSRDKYFEEFVSAIEAFAQKYAENTNGYGIVTVLTTDEQSHKRSRRAVTAPSDADDLNLAESYSEDFPVIFNIILWFGVLIVFSMMAIVVAIATMDPGRDSIIYRMTSTRIKKDN
ncbi:ATPase H(+)-transporting accessory protein 2 [Sitodiplosis mosellana]|uniref:ATPase H(+)-transporting accessory protein 2 n=1 Tax=Sitodiplosis mosellana TaxID=263140 RepID=UPI0024440E23|nr:ATPase H(+)-transporting accessory protein 2 [Sitodiplosis mosellana]